MSNSEMSIQSETPVGYDHALLRYVVPFFFDKQEDMADRRSAYEEICDAFNNKTRKKKDKKTGEESDVKVWEPMVDYGVSPDLYDHIAQWLLPEGGGDSRKTGRPEIGRSWHYAPFQLGSNQWKMLGWIDQDGNVLNTAISSLGVTVFVTGIGFVWFEVVQKYGKKAEGKKTFDALAGSNISELLNYSNELKELAKDCKRIVDLSIPRIRIDDEDLRGIIVENKKEQEKIKVLKGSLFEGESVLLDEEKLIACTQKNGQGLNELQLNAMRDHSCVIIPAHVKAMDNQQKAWDIYVPVPGLGKWIVSILEDTTGGIRYFASVGRTANGGKVQVPDKALLFAYTEADIVDKGILRETTCRIAKGYTDRYRISDAVKEATIGLFNDTCAYIGREGMGYVAGENAADFYKTDFRNRFGSVYFWTYMLLLQQSYGILNFSRKIAKTLPANPEAYLNDNDNGYYADSMDRLLLEMNSFSVKNKYAAVSSIHHINDFYRYGYAQLSIAEEMESLNEGLKALGEMQSDRRQREEEKREKERIRKEAELREEEEHKGKQKEAKTNKALTYLSFLAIISLLCDSIGLIAGIRDEINIYRGEVTVSLIAYSIAAVTLCALVIYTGIRAIRLFRKG